MWPCPWLLLTESSEAELGRGRLEPAWGRAGSLHFPERAEYWTGAAAMSSAGDPAPILRHVVRGAQGERVQREGRVHAAYGRKQSAARDEQVPHVVRAAVAVGDRVFGALPHDRAAEEVRKAGRGRRPGVDRARRPDDARAFFAHVLEDPHRVLVEAVDHARERKAVFVLAVGEHD